MISKNESSLWVDKYKPTTTKDIIGAQEITKKITEWLRIWTTKLDKKCILLSGPPGIGKTTIASLIAKESGYTAIEFNASDIRSKKAIQDNVFDMAMTPRILGLERRLIIMDEVDGMGSGDNGGMSELIRIIGLSCVPIICICNDRYDTKIRSLATHCYDIRMHRPISISIANRIVTIAKKEGISVDFASIKTLTEQNGNDVRQVLHCVQFASSVKDNILRESPFDSCSVILSNKTKQINERYNRFFVDCSLVPLLIQQNYIDVSKNGAFKYMTEPDAFDQLSLASDALSDMDLASSGGWDLLPIQAMSAVKAGYHTHSRTIQTFPVFSTWLSKHSSSKRFATYFANMKCGGFRLDYISYIQYICMYYLGHDCPTNAIQLLDAYSISKDTFMVDMQYISTFSNIYDNLTPKQKNALKHKETNSDRLIKGKVVKEKVVKEKVVKEKVVKEKVVKEKVVKEKVVKEKVVKEKAVKEKVVKEKVVKEKVVKEKVVKEKVVKEKVVKEKVVKEKVVKEEKN